MYYVLSKDTIEKYILPYLSQAKRGFKTKSSMVDIINCILYKLKTGVQWRLLPVASLFSGVVLNYQSVYWHFRKWATSGEWKNMWIKLLDSNKSAVDLSSANIDGSHSRAIRGGEQVGYQGRKSGMTTNSLYLTDSQGRPLAMSTPVAGNHNDLYDIGLSLDEIFSSMQLAGIRVDGLFINADAGFDATSFRSRCQEYGGIPNTALNPRNGFRQDEHFIDEQLYSGRYVIERTNAWIDSFRSLLNRFDTTVASWQSFNYISFAVLFLQKMEKMQKAKSNS